MQYFSESENLITDSERSTCILSIVVIVYNTGRYLAKTLESISNQDCTNLEIICVNDGSTDDSGNIINKYSKLNPHIQILEHEKNLGTHISRMDGMEKATGSYVWILDGDDSLPPKICSKVIPILKKYSADILHLNAVINNENYLDQRRIQNMVNFVKPFKGKLNSRDIFKSCFIDKTHRFNIWNKIFKKELITKSLPQMERLCLPKGQDMYEYFILSYNANSYVGLPKIIGYEYNFGNGISGHSKLNLSQFIRYCNMYYVACAIDRFSKDKNNLVTHASKICCEDLLEDNIVNWYRLEEKYMPNGFDKMIDNWKSIKVISKLAEYSWFNQGNIASNIVGSKHISNKSGLIKTIATYYHRLSNGGIQKVIPYLVKIWINAGYNVILITDEAPVDSDYSLPPNIKRYIVQDYANTDRFNYIKRAEQIKNILIENKVDLMVYHAWASQIILWDMMICKCEDVRFVTYCHNIFPMMMGGGYAYFSAMPKIYRLMDAVITLSDTDTKFWKYFNSNVVKVYNPLTLMPSESTIASLESKNILWIGRIAPEKRPEEAISIFKKVHDVIPDSTLIFVGDGPNWLKNKIVNLIKINHLSDFVLIKGFIKDVSEIFSESSVFLSTSEYEGYMLTLAESLSSGVPVVMYDLPYLTLVRECECIVRVPQENKDLAALEICKLLSDQKYRKELGKKGREYALKLEHYDLTSEWNSIITLVSNAHDNLIPEIESEIMWNTLLHFYHKGVLHHKNELSSIKNSISYRIGRAITLIPRKIFKKKPL